MKSWAKHIRYTKPWINGIYYMLVLFPSLIKKKKKTECQYLGKVFLKEKGRKKEKKKKWKIIFLSTHSPLKETEMYPIIEQWFSNFWSQDQKNYGDSQRVFVYMSSIS